VGHRQAKDAARLDGGPLEPAQGRRIGCRAGLDRLRLDRLRLDHHEVNGEVPGGGLTIALVELQVAPLELVDDAAPPDGRHLGLGEHAWILRWL